MVNVVTNVGTLLGMSKVNEDRELLLQALKKEPDSSEILFKLGDVDLRKGALESAGKWLIRAADADPDNPEIRIQLCEVLEGLNRVGKAIEQYQIIISIEPNNFTAHSRLAALLGRARQYEDAAFHFDYACRIRPDSADCYACLATIYELLNKWEDALEAAMSAIAINGEHALALSVLARIRAQQERYIEAEEILRKITKNATDDALYSRSLTDLGHVLDKQGLYHDAFQAFQAGNEAKSRLVHISAHGGNDLDRIISESVRWFNSENIRDWSSGPKFNDARRTPIFFVGFPRSGTTLVEQILNQNPDIVTSSEEPFVQNVIASLPQLSGSNKPYPDSMADIKDEHIPGIREAYWRFAAASLANLKNDSLLVDKLPMNMLAIGFISRIFPDSPILVAIRDPRDVCLSCFMQGFEANIAMSRFLSMESTVGFYVRLMNLWMHFTDVLPINYFQYRYEDLVEDFDTTTREIFSFLDLEYPENASAYHKAAEKREIYTPSYRDVVKPIYKHRAARWKNYERYLEPYLDQLQPFLKRYGYV